MANMETFSKALMASEDVKSYLGSTKFQASGAYAEIHDGALVVLGDLAVNDAYGATAKDYNVYLSTAPTADTAKVVIVDLDWNLDSEMIKNVLEIADNILVVVDQKVTTLNRVPEELYTYRNQLQAIDLVVNRFYNIKHLEKDRVADFFREIEIYNGKTFDIRVNRVFTVSDDAKSVLQGLAESEYY